MIFLIKKEKKKGTYINCLKILLNLDEQSQLAKAKNVQNAVTYEYQITTFLLLKASLFALSSIPSTSNSWTLTLTL